MRKHEFSINLRGAINYRGWYKYEFGRRYIPTQPFYHWHHCKWLKKNNVSFYQAPNKKLLWPIDEIIQWQTIWVNPTNILPQKLYQDMESSSLNGYIMVQQWYLGLLVHTHISVYYPPVFYQRVKFYRAVKIDMVRFRWKNSVIVKY